MSDHSGRWNRSAAAVLCAVLVAMAACDPQPTSIPPGPTPIASAPVVERPLPPPTPIDDVDGGVEAGAPSEPSAPADPAPAPAAGADSGLVQDGGLCERAIECASGICEGLGCVPERKGICMSRNRSCTRDYRAFCGCDGKTFQGSGSCPGRRFAARGECK